MDEISNTPLATQGKLLEAIEEKKIRRLGETAVRKVDVRLVSATNQNLRQMVDQGLFRADLFYRISVTVLVQWESDKTGVGFKVENRL